VTPIRTLARTALVAATAVWALAACAEPDFSALDAGAASGAGGAGGASSGGRGGGSILPTGGSGGADDGVGGQPVGSQPMGGQPAAGGQPGAGGGSGGGSAAGASGGGQGGVAGGAGGGGGAGAGAGGEPTGGVPADPAAIHGEWLSEGGDVAPFFANPPASIVRVEASFRPDGTYDAESRTAGGDRFPGEGTYTVDVGTTPHTIVLTQSAPEALELAGIWTVIGDTLTYEVVQTGTRDAPPTPEAGFGSTAGGRYGEDLVQIFRRER
jgi:hypothetical protein